MQEIRRFATGEVVLREGEPGEVAYLIIKGRVSITKDGPTGTLRLTTMGPGQMIGEISLLDDGPRIASAIALEPLTVRVLKKEELLRMLRKDSELSLQMLRIMAYRLRDSHRVIRDMQAGEPDMLPTAWEAAAPKAGAPAPEADPSPSPMGKGSIPPLPVSKQQQPTNSPSPAGNVGPDPVITVHLAGITDAARNSLDGAVLTIDEYPYLIGRDTRSSSADNDLWIPDAPPYQVSRNHLAIILDRNEILLTDRGSQLGFGLDGERYGYGDDEERTAYLTEGHHTLVIGGEDSPYRFRMSVLKTAV